MDYEIKIYFFREISKRPPQKNDATRGGFQADEHASASPTDSRQGTFPDISAVRHRSRTSSDQMSSAARNGAIRAPLRRPKPRTRVYILHPDAPRIKTAGSIVRSRERFPDPSESGPRSASLTARSDPYRNFSDDISCRVRRAIRRRTGRPRHRPVRGRR